MRESMKKVLRISLAAVALVAVGGCSSISVQTNYDPGADFTKYKTYSWLETQQITSPFVRAHIEAAVDKQLQARGLVRADKGADLKVAVHTRFSREITLSLFSNSWGYGWGWAPAYGYGDRTATTQVQEVPVGTLIVDLVDAARNELAWRGTATSELHSEDSAEKEHDVLDEAVRRLFERFPPKKKS